MSRLPAATSTQHALLGLLSIKPMSGYDIRQLIPESIGYFWSESYGQIYPALRDMAEARLVEKHTEQAPGKPNRHVYSLTEDGRAALLAWLDAPPRFQPKRNELLLKLFFGAQAPPQVCVGHVHAFLAAQQKELGTYQAVAARLQHDHAANPQLPFWLITLSRGRHEAQAAIAWAQETLELLQQQPAPHQMHHQPTERQPTTQGEMTHA